MLLEGRLLDEDGAAIPGAELVLIPVGDPRTCIWRDNRVQPIARSDRQGRFRFENLDRRDWARLAVSAWGFVPRDFDLGQLAARVFPAEYRFSAAAACGCGRSTRRAFRWTAPLRWQGRRATSNGSRPS